MPVAFLGTLSLASILVLSGALAPEAAAGHLRHHHHRYHARWGYPVPFVYPPAYSPHFALGVGHYPVAVGFGFAAGPGDPRGSLRTEVRPRRTEVFVDGYYAGVVDDFDGSFQKLRLEPGPHTITLYLEGHRIHEDTIYSSLGSSVKIRHIMEPLEPGEPVPARPSPGSPAAYSTAPPPPPAPAAPPPPPAAREYGTLMLRSQPADAEVWIDGERWNVSLGTEPFSIHLPAGPHELVLQKEGFEPFEIPIEIRAGETEAMNVRLASVEP